MDQQEPGSDAVTSEPFDPQPPSPPTPPPVRRGSRYVPAVLDALIPGLGHLVAGRRRRAIIFLTPVVIALVVGIWIVLTTSAPRLVAELVGSEVIWGLLAIQVVFLLWRLVAVGSSIWNPTLPRPGRRDVIPVALVLLLVIVPQAYGGYATEIARESIDEVFVEPPPVAVGPSEAPEPDPSFLDEPDESPSAEPSASELPSPTPTVPRINGLIVGVDAGVGRNTYLTDTMIVVSLDPVARSVSLVSIPRDMVDVPLADGRKFRGKINSLVSYARHHPKQFPGSDGTGFDVLMDALGTLLKQPIQYYATVNLGGFVRVVDTLGGVNVNVVRSFCDRTTASTATRTASRSPRADTTSTATRRSPTPASASRPERATSPEPLASRRSSRASVTPSSGAASSTTRSGSSRRSARRSRRMSRARCCPTSPMPPAISPGRTRIARSSPIRWCAGPYDSRGSIQVPKVGDIRKLAAAIFPPTGTLPSDKYLAPPSRRLGLTAAA